MKKIQEDAYICPSFSYYSANELAEIAAKVAVEGDEDEFEFTLLIHEHEEFAACNGQVRSIFPVFDRDLIVINAEREGSDLNRPPSCSSSEGDELESVPPGTYCIWRPKAAAAAEALCRKSQSTGSTPKSWRFSDLLRRSNSEGKDNYVILNPKAHGDRDDLKPRKLIEASKTGKVAGAKAVSGGGPPGLPSPHELLYTWNRAANAEKRKRSYLPYRQELVGFFGNVNSFSRSFPHF